MVNSTGPLATPTKSMGRLSMGREDEGGSPPKRPRRASAQRLTPYASDGDVGEDSDGSVFGGFDGANDEDEVAV